MLDIQIGSHHLQAWPERALYWPAHNCLLLADLHLGKADTFRHYGIGIPQTLQHSDLARLQQLLLRLQPARCLLLGDFVHGNIVHKDTAKAWNALVNTFAQTEFVLVVGNHDRSLHQLPLQLDTVCSELRIDNVLLTHEPVPQDRLQQGDWNLHGHIHPAMRIGTGRHKLPALALRKPYLMLPAFSEFTAGVDVSAGCEGLWVFVEQEATVVQVR